MRDNKVAHLMHQQRITSLISPQTHVRRKNVSTFQCKLSHGTMANCPLAINKILCNFHKNQCAYAFQTHFMHLHKSTCMTHIILYANSRAQNSCHSKYADCGCRQASMPISSPRQQNFQANENIEETEKI